MKQAIVIDSSREIPSELYNNQDIFPVGYAIEDSNEQIILERAHAHELQTARLISVVNQDKKAKIFAPHIKEFVELYTFLAEEYESLISIHSSYFTPAVFEHALVAKKMVSGIAIDLVDSPLIGSAAGLFAAELVNFVPNAKNINDIRKKAIDLNKSIKSYVITENEHLIRDDTDRTNQQSNFPLSMKNYNLYHYSHTKWEHISSNRNSRNLFREIHERITSTGKTKKIKQAYFSSSPNFMRDTKEVIRRIRKASKTETEQSLISRYLLGKEYSSIAFL
ncbi:MAG: DegV family protein [Candidatus Heimdallarchaeaceae archaeon]